MVKLGRCDVKVEKKKEVTEKAGSTSLDTLSVH